MGITVTTQSLYQSNACPEAYDFFTGSFCSLGNPWYSGSNYEAYFEKEVIYPFTCSNKQEVSWLRLAASKFEITGSFYNSETNTSQIYYRVNNPIPYFEDLNDTIEYVRSGANYTSYLHKIASESMASGSGSSN